MKISSVLSQSFGLDTEGQEIIEQRLPIICRFISQIVPEAVDCIDIKVLPVVIGRIRRQVSESQLRELGLQLGLLEDGLLRVAQRYWRVDGLCTAAHPTGRLNYC